MKDLEHQVFTNNQNIMILEKTLADKAKEVTGYIDY